MFIYNFSNYVLFSVLFEIKVFHILFFISNPQLLGLDYKESEY